MKLMKRQQAPIVPRNLFQNFFDRFLEEPLELEEHLPELFRRGYTPAINVSEDENSYVVSAELPGLEEKDIEVEVMGNQLTISGERKFREEKKEKDFHRIESAFGSFSRTVALPNMLKTDQADAVYKNGMLTVTFPKVEPTPTSKIQVNAG